MFKNLVLVVCVFYCSTSCANEDINNFLNNVVESFNNQDCVSYSSNYSSDTRQKRRREAGIFFASNDAKMSLKESHVLHEDKENAEVAVSYTIDGFDYVSRVFLTKEDGEWKISKEIPVRTESSKQYATTRIPERQSQTEVYTSNPFSSSNTSLPPQNQSGCTNGKCGGPQAPFSTLRACRDYGFEPIPCRNGNCSIR